MTAGRGRRHTPPAFFRGLATQGLDASGWLSSYRSAGALRGRRPFLRAQSASAPSWEQGPHQERWSLSPRFSDQPYKV